jgi:DNA-binding protein HU-beta
MTKTDLIREMAKKAGLRVKDAESALNAFLEVVTEALKKGEPVEIRGFGAFRMVERSARTARNPRTGKKVEIPPKLVPTFKAGKDLKEATVKVLKK